MTISEQVQNDYEVCGIIIYAYLQAVGVINSHESGCFLNPLQQ